MEEVEIQARVTRLLCSQDRVLKSAIEVVNTMSRDCAYLLVAAMCHAFEGNFLLTENEIAGFYDDWLQGRRQQRDDGDRLGLLVDELQSYGLALADGGFQIDISELPIALSALHFDLKFRRDGDMVAGLGVLLDLFSANPKKRQRRGRAKPTKHDTLKKARAGI